MVVRSLILLNFLMVGLMTMMPRVLGFCPNNCNGHGICETAHGARSCFCFPGYVGPDCSSKACPAGVAWVDYPQQSDVAHYDFTECSNMGKCNRVTGDCECRKGFTGAACDQSKLALVLLIIIVVGIIALLFSSFFSHIILSRFLPSFLPSFYLLYFFYVFFSSGSGMPHGYRIQWSGTGLLWSRTLYVSCKYQ